MEAPPRFELGVKALQASALPLGYGALRSKRAAQALLEFVFGENLPEALALGVVVGYSSIKKSEP